MKVITYKEKKIYIKSIDISGTYVFASYNEDYSKMFTLKIKDLELSEAEVSNLKKNN